MAVPQVNITPWVTLRLTHKVIPLAQQLLDLEALRHSHAVVEDVAWFSSRVVHYVRIRPSFKPDGIMITYVGQTKVKRH